MSTDGLAILTDIYGPAAREAAAKAQVQLDEQAKTAGSQEPEVICQECQRRLWFVLAYARSFRFVTEQKKVEDYAFVRAANNWIKKVRENTYPTQLFGQMPNFDANRDDHLVFIFSTKADFFEMWNSIDAYSDRKPYVGAIFCHSSQPWSQAFEVDGNSGTLEFQPDIDNKNSNSDISLSEINNMNILKWCKGGSLTIHACNSGTNGVAKAFSKHQKIRTYGAIGWSFFSKNWSHYVKIAENDQDIYLECYDRGRASLKVQPAIQGTASFIGQMIARNIGLKPPSARVPMKRF